MTKKYLGWIFVLAALLMALLVVVAYSLSHGEITIPITKIPSILLGEEQTIEYTILGKIRLPRVLLGIAVGGSLSLAGVILQGIYRNPLVEPYTLGISGGAALGVAITIVTAVRLNLNNIILPASGFLGALVTIVFVYFFSLYRGRLVTNKMVLVGVMISYLASSAMMFLMSITTSENLHGIIFWIMGSLDETDSRLIGVAQIVSLSGLIISYLFIRPLNAMRLGETEARHLGIHTDTAIKILFVVASLLTGVSVAVAGIIGFVGLIIPQFLRLLIGSDFRILLVTSFISGGIFIVLCDTIARTIIAPNELPIGVITGILGGASFLAILAHNNKSKLGA
jgi:iron complex transport system permease protein